ncbi:unnamed protein product [Schistosoma guineensis]|nr:unnamed protein product [Schistosoma guineensis]
MFDVYKLRINFISCVTLAVCSYCWNAICLNITKKTIFFYEITIRSFRFSQILIAMIEEEKEKQERYNDDDVDDNDWIEYQYE